MYFIQFTIKNVWLTEGKAKNARLLLENLHKLNNISEFQMNTERWNLTLRSREFDLPDAFIDMNCKYWLIVQRVS